MLKGSPNTNLSNKESTDIRKEDWWLFPVTPTLPIVKSLVFSIYF